MIPQRAGSAKLHISEAVRRTYARYNIRVNCVVTVLTHTTLTASLIQNELTLKASVALHPLGHIGEPAEVGSAIRWFMSPEQS